MIFKNRSEFNNWLLNMAANIRFNKKLDDHLKTCNEVLDHYEKGSLHELYFDNQIKSAEEMAIIIRDYKDLIESKIEYRDFLNS